jgi:hypothetical protein
MKFHESAQTRFQLPGEKRTWKLLGTYSRVETREALPRIPRGPSGLCTAHNRSVRQCIETFVSIGVEYAYCMKEWLFSFRQQEVGAVFGGATGACDRGFLTRSYFWPSD